MRERKPDSSASKVRTLTDENHGAPTGFNVGQRLSCKMQRLSGEEITAVANTVVMRKKDPGYIDLMGCMF